ncbi:hypothetical protein Lser_V15G05059 [Lactuca serriola]
MGTQGYVAPEYMARGHLTVRSDTYSFGVVLLKLLIGRRYTDKNCPSGVAECYELVKALEQIQELQKAFENVGIELMIKENRNGNENKVVSYPRRVGSTSVYKRWYVYSVWG